MEATINIPDDILDKIKKTNFNVYDVIILATCWKKELSITDLQREMNIAYKNLFPHLKKLQEWDALKIIDSGKGRKKKIIVSEHSLELVICFFKFFKLDAYISDPSKN
jgi:predicted transcriptional regulator